MAQTAVVKLDRYVLLPEPRAMRNVNSRPLGGGERTVVTPAYETATGLALYEVAEFAKLGISVDTFTERAMAAAEKRLASEQPQFIKDDEGVTRYAVYRGESPFIATMIMAPSLAKLASRLFKGDVWAVLPDRHSLYLFPADPELLAEFTDDLQLRYASNPYAASCEVFLIKDGKPPEVVGTFGD
jgi:hypothetical protein